MIGYLRGQVLENHEGKLLLTIGDETGAVGYAITVPQTAGSDALLPGKTAELFIYSHVREDAFDLYGFATKGEKELFLTLLTVNGIGPKMALGILSKVDSSTLIHAILDGDKNSLTQIPGIGKKTAERVVLELADVVRKKFEAGVFTQLAPQSGQGGEKVVKTTDLEPVPGKLGQAYGMFRDAKEALVGLGYREQEVTGALNRLLEEKTSEKPASAEELIRGALKRLG